MATSFRGGGICNDHFVGTFPAECISERILKIGQYLANVRTKVWCRFLTRGVLQQKQYLHVAKKYIHYQIYDTNIKNT